MTALCCSWQPSGPCLVCLRSYGSGYVASRPQPHRLRMDWECVALKLLMAVLLLGDLSGSVLLLAAWWFTHSSSSSEKITQRDWWRVKSLLCLDFLGWLGLSAEVSICPSRTCEPLDGRSSNLSQLFSWNERRTDLNMAVGRQSWDCSFLSRMRCSRWVNLAALWTKCKLVLASAELFGFSSHISITCAETNLTPSRASIGWLAHSSPTCANSGASIMTSLMRVWQPLLLSFHCSWAKLYWLTGLIF